MGNNLNYQYICTPSHPFRQQFPHLYSSAGPTIHQRFGFIELYRQNRSQKINLFVKDTNFPSKKEMMNVVQKLSRRVNQNHPNLLRIYDFVGSQRGETCGNLNNCRVYVQFLEGSLKREIKHRKKYKNYSFSQQQLQKILFQLSSALVSLHSNRQFHGQIKMSDVLVDQNNRIKLIDKSVATVSCFTLGQQGQNVRILRGKGILFAPSIMKCLQNSKTQINAYDPFKADVFSIGMIMLQAASFEDCELNYDYENFLIKRDRLDLILSKLRFQYSDNFLRVLESMLVQYDQQRPTSRQILNLVQELSRVKNSSIHVGQPLMLGERDGVNITFS